MSDWEVDIEDENAGDLIFPETLRGKETLMISEVYLLIKAREELKKKKNEDEDDDEVELDVPEFTQMTLEYCERFKKFHDINSITSARRILIEQKLTRYELASMGNLLPETVEEAFAHNPSIGDRVDSEDMQQALTDVEITTSAET